MSINSAELAYCSNQTSNSKGYQSGKIAIYRTGYDQKSKLDEIVSDVDRIPMLNKDTDKLYNALPDALKSTGSITLRAHPGQEAMYKALKSYASLIVINGSNGTGKTLSALASSIERMQEGLIEGIAVVRANVSEGESVGALPGGLLAKQRVLYQPLIENLITLNAQKLLLELQEVDAECRNLGSELIRQSTRRFQFVSLEQIRGRTFNNIDVIVDDAQLLTEQQMQAVLGRSGVNSRLVICGDEIQITDTMKDKNISSGLPFAREIINITEPEMPLSEECKYIHQNLEPYMLENGLHTITIPENDEAIVVNVEASAVQRSPLAARMARGFLSAIEKAKTSK